MWSNSGTGFGYEHRPYIDNETGRFVISMLNGAYAFRAETMPAGNQPEFSPELRAMAYNLR